MHTLVAGAFKLEPLAAHQFDRSTRLLRTVKSCLRLESSRCNAQATGVCFFLPSLPRHERIPAHKEAKRPVRSLCDPDAWCNLDIAILHRTPRTDDNRMTLERQTVHSLVDAQRGAKFPGPIGELPIASGFGAPPAHERQSIQRLERANQHSTGQPFRTGNSVDAPVHPIDEIDVGVSRWTVERLGAERAPNGCVAGGVVLPDVRLGLNNNSAREAVV